MSGAEDIMVDLETMDTSATAAILSIGAVRIDWEREIVCDPFYVVVDLQSCLDIGLTQSASTKAFWDKQSEEARRVFTDPNVSIQAALTSFHRYLNQWNRNKILLWGNGSDFDNTIIANAYSKLSLDAPWRFYNNRCFRTIRKMLASKVEEPAREGTHHNALDDAKFQAEVLLKYKPWIDRGERYTR